MRLLTLERSSTTLKPATIHSHSGTLLPLLTTQTTLRPITVKLTSVPTSTTPKSIVFTTLTNTKSATVKPTVVSTAQSNITSLIIPLNTTLTSDEIFTINNQLSSIRPIHNPSQIRSTTQSPRESRFEKLQMLPLLLNGDLQPPLPTPAHPLRIINNPPPTKQVGSHVRWPDTASQVSTNPTSPRPFQQQTTQEQKPIRQTSTTRKPVPFPIPTFWDNWSPNQKVIEKPDEGLTHSHFDLTIRSSSARPFQTTQEQKPQTNQQNALPNQIPSSILTDDWLLDLLEAARITTTTLRSVVANNFFPPASSNTTSR